MAWQPESGRARWPANFPLDPCCYCGIAAKICTTTKPGPYQGKKFYGCPRYYDANGGCSFFRPAPELDLQNIGGLATPVHRPQPRAPVTSPRSAEGALSNNDYFYGSNLQPKALKYENYMTPPPVGSPLSLPGQNLWGKQPRPVKPEPTGGPTGRTTTKSTPAHNPPTTVASQTPKKQTHRNQNREVSVQKKGELLVARQVPRAPGTEVRDRITRLEALGNPWNSLHEFQREAVRFGLQRCGRVLLADDMGLGKTLQAITLAAAYALEDWPLIIVTPPSMALVWKSELRKWLPEELQPADEDLVIVKSGAQTALNSLVQRVRASRDSGIWGRAPPKGPASGKPQVVIVNYSMLIKDTIMLALKGLRSNFIIADESHQVKSLASQRTQVVTDFVKQAKRAVLISGTPSLARPIEVYPQVEMLQPGLLGTFDNFGMRYCDGKPALSWQLATKPSRTMDYRGVTSHRLEELRKKLQCEVMIRRMKTEVEMTLPDKMRRRMSVQIGSPCKEEIQSIKLEMKYLERSIDAGTADSDRVEFERLALMTKLFKTSGIGKAPHVVSHVCALLAGGHKVVVFGHHKEVLDALELGINQHLTGGMVLVENQVVEGEGGGQKCAPAPKSQNRQPKRKRKAVVDDDEYLPEPATKRQNKGRNRAASLSDDDYELPAKKRTIRKSVAVKKVVAPSQKRSKAASRASARQGCPRCIRIDGSTTVVERQRAVESFQNDNSVRAAVLSTTAAGVGITLTAASVVVFAELNWTPGTLTQAEDRAHRIGQRNSLEVHYMTAPGSIDDLMWGTVIKKLDIVHSVVGNGDAEAENEFAGMRYMQRCVVELANRVHAVEVLDLTQDEAGPRAPFHGGLASHPANALAQQSALDAAACRPHYDYAHSKLKLEFKCEPKT